MKKKILTIILVLAMIVGIAIPAFAAGNDGTTNKYIGGVGVKVDKNNANFHCNGLGGNGRVWPEKAINECTGIITPHDFKKTPFMFYFDKVDGTTKWTLRYVKDEKGVNIVGDVICPNCGSTEWISYSNNSGAPDGKNIQLQHPMREIEIIKVWLDAEGNVIKSNGLSAKFTITWTGKDGVVRTLKNVGPGKISVPIDLIDSLVITETSVTKNYTLVKIDGRNVIGVISGQLAEDKITFTNQEDPYVIVYKDWLDGNPEGLTALFDIYREVTSQDEDEDGNPISSIARSLVRGNVRADDKVYLNPKDYIGTYVVVEQPKEGYIVQGEETFELTTDIRVGTFRFENEPDGGEKAALSFLKKVEDKDIIDWLEEYFELDRNDPDDVLVIMGILDGLEFRLTGPNAPNPPGYYSATPDYTEGKVTFGNVEPGAYTLSEVIKGDAVGIFKAMGSIDIILAPGDDQVFVIGGTIGSYGFSGTDFDWNAEYGVEAHTNWEAYDMGLPLNLGAGSLLNNGGDMGLYYSVVLPDRTPTYASFCANEQSTGLYGPYKAVSLTEGTHPEANIGAVISALNYIDVNIGSLDNIGRNKDADYAKYIAQIVIWNLYCGVDAEDMIVNLPDYAKDDVRAALANTSGYAGDINGLALLIPVHGNATTGQPQLVPLKGTFYVQNEPDEGGEKWPVDFLKVKYGNLLAIITWFNDDLDLEFEEFGFELYKLVDGEDDEYIGTYYNDATGMVTAENLEPGSYKFVELVKIVLEDPVGSYGYKHTWTVGELYFSIANNGKVTWAEGTKFIDDKAIIDNEIMCKNGLQLTSDGEWGSWSNCGAYTAVITMPTCTLGGKIDLSCNCGEHGHYDPDAKEGTQIFFGAPTGHTFLPDDAEVYVWQLNETITIAELNDHPYGLAWFGFPDYFAGCSVGFCETCNMFVCY